MYINYNCDIFKRASHFSHMFLLLVLCVTCWRHKDEILEMDGHRFRQAVFHRDMLETWVTLLSAQDLEGHVFANSVFDEAFNIGRGFLRFAYLDTAKNPHIPRRLNLNLLPQFCVFHAAGETCVPANISARELINLASSYLPDFTEEADVAWLKKDEQNPVAILFTDKPETPLLWVAIASAFRGQPLRIGVSRDKPFGESLSVTRFPTILLHNYSHNIPYDGDNEFSALLTTLQQFLQKKLTRVRSGLKVHPISEFDKYCTGDKICFIYSSESPSKEMEELRQRHSTGMFEFFFGVSGNQPGNSIVAVHKGHQTPVDDLASYIDGILHPSSQEL